MSLPPNAAKYSESPVFTQDTIPNALRKDHQTKANVWGKIVIEEGTLLYMRDTHPAQRVSVGDTAIILPEEPHHVAPDAGGPVSFKVEFYRVPAEETQQ